MPALLLAILIGVPAVASAEAGAVQPELIERTLAIVGGEAITLSDVRAALALGLVEGSGDADPIPAATRRLIERALILREVERYAPPEPDDAAIDERLRAMTARFASTDAFQTALAAAAFTEEQLRTWVRDELRMAAYINQRFTDADRRADLVADWIADLRRRTPVVEILKN